MQIHSFTGGHFPFYRGVQWTHTNFFCPTVTDRSKQAQNLSRGPWARTKNNSHSEIATFVNDKPNENNVKAHGPAANSHCECTVFVTDKFDSQNEIHKA